MTREISNLLLGLALGVLLFALCGPRRVVREIHHVVDTIKITELRKDTVVKWKERVKGWQKLKPETVYVSPETALVETIWRYDSPYTVYYARGGKDEASFTAIKRFTDDSGRARLIVRQEKYQLPDQWVLIGTDTGLVLKGRYVPQWNWRIGVKVVYDGQIKVKPRLGAELKYRGFRVDANTDGTRFEASVNRLF